MPVRKTSSGVTIEVVFQPQLLLPTRPRLYGAEALIRPVSPAGESIRPDLYIEDLEQRRDLPELHAIFSHVLLHACTWSNTWSRALERSIVVGVNISPLQIENAQPILSIIDNVLKATNTHPSRIEIEVTETAQITRSMLQTLEAIMERGISVAVDDFGKGFTTLTLLRDSRMCIKLDKTFLIESTDRDKIILGILLLLAKSLGLRSIVEGVSDKERLQYFVAALRERDMRGIGQGFGIGLPMLPEEILEFARKFERRKPLDFKDKK